MKYISAKKAGNEPKEVVAKRATPGSSFDDLPKAPLRQALLKEQGYICAYCMQRIKDDSNSTKIEHWSPRNRENEKDYMNLLAVCKGNEGRQAEEQHCDTMKGSTSITVSPLKSTCEQWVKFDPGGNIYSDDSTVEIELKNILGLNRQHLIDERAKLLDRVKEAIQKIAKNNPDTKIKKSDLTAMLNDWQTLKSAEYEPFCQVAIAYIQKKIARLP
jgi:uncharacterized protein (TIGR02646 family)